MIQKEEIMKEWRGGVYLCSADSAMEADILESKLRGEGITCIRRYEGAGNYMEIVIGRAAKNLIDLYVAPEHLADAQNIIIPIDLEDCSGFDPE